LVKINGDKNNRLANPKIQKQTVEWRKFTNLAAGVETEGREMRPGELSTSGIPQGMSGEELMKEKLARNGLGGGKMMATGSVRTVTHNKRQSKLDLLRKRF
jgi:hypothetical protein